MTDGMMADFFHFDHDFVAGVVTHIINEMRGINWAVYDVTSTLPGTIEWE
jgi:GMP synthase (glutamine-hydrolysing)